MIQTNYLSLSIKEDVSITMQEAMLIELRVTTNNSPATDQPASHHDRHYHCTFIVTKNWLFSLKKSTWQGGIKSVNNVQLKILKFRPCCKDRHRLYVLKVHGIKVSSMKAGSENGQKLLFFFRENISSYIIVLIIILSNQCL